MRTKEELLEELKKEVEVLRKYFDTVNLFDIEAFGQFNIVVEDESMPNKVFSRKYRTFPPRGNLCLCWDSSQCTDYKDFKVSLGDGYFAEDTKGLKECTGTSYDHWKDLGINVLDKIKEN